MRWLFVKRANPFLQDVMAEYHRAAEAVGDELVCSETAEVPQGWVPDAVLTLLESLPFLTDDTLARLDRLVPYRDRRFVLDFDGQLAPPLLLPTDTNCTEEGSAYWRALATQLGGRWLEPTLGHLHGYSERFLFFGCPALHEPTQHYWACAYVGSTWHRWEQVARLFAALHAADIGPVAVYGSYWDGSLPEPHAWQTDVEPFRIDPRALKAWNVAVHPHVPNFLGAMSTAHCVPIFVRPALAALQIVTPRMFETVAAWTVPLLGEEARYALPLYGPYPPAVLDFPLVPVVREAMAQAPDLAQRTWLLEHHGYHRRWAELQALVV